MGELALPKGRTALLLIDPYNDFLADDGKLWRRVADTKGAEGLHGHMKAVIAAARAAGVTVFIVPHHRYAPGDLDTWAHPNPYIQASARGLVFEKGGWGGEWHPDFTPQPGDVIVAEHWSSGFSGTDLDMRLKQQSATHLVLIGLAANTCVEGTGRSASELGYHVTLVRDATAAFSDEALHAAHDINGPTYAHAIVTSAEVVEALNSLS